MSIWLQTLRVFPVDMISLVSLVKVSPQSSTGGPTPFGSGQTRTTADGQPLEGNGKIISKNFFHRKPSKNLSVLENRNLGDVTESKLFPTG